MTERWSEDIMTDVECLICGKPVTLTTREEDGVTERYTCASCGHEQEHQRVCPSCEGPRGPAGRGVMNDTLCSDPCHND